MQALTLLNSEHALLPYKVIIRDQEAVLECFGLELVRLQRILPRGHCLSERASNVMSMLLFHLASPAPIKLEWDFRETIQCKHIALTLSSLSGQVILGKCGWPRIFEFQGSLVGRRQQGTTFIKLSRQVDTITIDFGDGASKLIMDPSRPEHASAILQFFPTLSRQDRNSTMLRVMGLWSLVPHLINLRKSISAVAFSVVLKTIQAL